MAEKNSSVIIQYDSIKHDVENVNRKVSNNWKRYNLFKREGNCNMRLQDQSNGLIILCEDNGCANVQKQVMATS